MQTKVIYSITRSDGTPATLAAYYDDEDTAESAAVGMLGTATRSGGTVIMSQVIGEDGQLTNEFEF